MLMQQQQHSDMSSQQQSQQHMSQIFASREAYRTPSKSDQKQGPILSLTLDEFQSFISEPGQKVNVENMNMDEFLKNIWTLEENQAVEAALASGADQQQISLVQQMAFQKQSSISVPPNLSQKTVDEVWKGILPVVEGRNPHRQVTFGEITLEEFLLNAGVGVEKGPFHGIGNVLKNQLEGLAGSSTATLAAIHNAANQHQANWINFQLQANAVAAYAQQHPLQPQSVPSEGMVDLASQKRSTEGNVLSRQAQPSLALSTIRDESLSPGNAYASLPAPPRGKKRSPGDTGELVVERRQRRMIKNRESAARSRARKQVILAFRKFAFLKLKRLKRNLRYGLSHSLSSLFFQRHTLWNWKLRLCNLRRIMMP